MINITVGFTEHISDVCSQSHPCYDYVDDSLPTVKFKAASGNVIINHGKGGEEMYHETVLYHSVGPSISEPDANVYEDDVLYQLPEAGQNRSTGHVYEDPTLSQVYS